MLCKHPRSITDGYSKALYDHSLPTLHYRIASPQFSAIVAFPLAVPISSLFFLVFFSVSFKFPSVPISPVLPCEFLMTRQFASSFPWDPAPSPRWPWGSRLSWPHCAPGSLSCFQPHFPQLLQIRGPVPQLPIPSQTPAQKQF